MNSSQARAVQNYRTRLSERGLIRFEVLGLGVDRELIRSLARRLAEEGPEASVLRAEKEVVPDLLAEAVAFQGTLGGAGTRAAMESFMASGGQTPAGELRLGELAAELHRPG